MEQEATYWSLLLFGPLVFLHPYTLACPDPTRELLAEGLIQVLAPERTPEEIRQKDRAIEGVPNLRGPEPGFQLPGIPQAGETRETSGNPGRNPGSAARKTIKIPGGGETRKALAGDLFLCIIHDWLNKEWEIDLSLEQFGEQELGLARIMDQSPEFSSDWAASEKTFVAPTEAEMVCPPALTAWKELRAQLAPGPGLLITNQPWVRRDPLCLDR